MLTEKITGISSMATRQMLADLATAYQQANRVNVQFESVGGVDAAKRVQAGENFDVVVLASNAIDKLIGSGHALPGTKVDLALSSVAVAVRAGQPAPDISTESALRDAVVNAHTVGYSTGPSGVALLQILSRWGVADGMQARLVKAPAGVPVGELVASGDVALGLQQLSELMHISGIEVLTPMPAGCEISTTFCGAVCSNSPRPRQAGSLLAFLAGADANDARHRHGMEPA